MVYPGSDFPSHVSARFVKMGWEPCLSGERLVAEALPSDTQQRAVIGGGACRGRCIRPGLTGREALVPGPANRVQSWTEGQTPHNKTAAESQDQTGEQRHSPGPGPLRDLGLQITAGGGAWRGCQRGKGSGEGCDTFISRRTCGHLIGCLLHGPQSGLGNLQPR